MQKHQDQNIINQNNYTLYASKGNGVVSWVTDLFHVISKVGQGVSLFLESIINFIITIKNNLSNDNEEEKTKPLFC
jgi:hypothetical protein